MRYRLETYDLKINPRAEDKSWSQNENVHTNVNGLVSNPLNFYNGKQSFTLELYDRATYTTPTPIIGNYIAVGEDSSSSDFHLLKSDGTVDIRTKTGGVKTGYTIRSGSVTIPSSKPISMSHADSSIAFLYRDGISITIVITDKFGNANRKYTYDSQTDIYMSESIAFNGTWVYVVNPYGKLYRVDINTGENRRLLDFPDFTENINAGRKRYGSSLILSKGSKQFVGILQDNQDIVFVDFNNKIAGKSETKIKNVLDITYSATTGQSFVLANNKVHSMFMNTCRLDLSIIKEVMSLGQVTIYDELGFPSLLGVDNIRITRNRNMGEARYEVQFSGDIIYANKTFGSQWQKNRR